MGSKLRQHGSANSMGHHRRRRSSLAWPREMAQQELDRSDKSEGRSYRNGPLIQETIAIYVAALRLSAQRAFMARAILRFWAALMVRPLLGDVRVRGPVVLDRGAP